MPTEPTTYVDENGRQCTSCGEYKEWDAYGSSGRDGYNGRHAMCKPCRSARVSRQGRILAGKPPVPERRMRNDYWIIEREPGYGLVMRLRLKSEFMEDLKKGCVEPGTVVRHPETRRRYRVVGCEWAWQHWRELETSSVALPGAPQKLVWLDSPARED